MTNQGPQKSYHEEVAEKVIEQLKKGTAPWLKPWNGESTLPHNPVTGTRYRGGNLVWLKTVEMMNNYSDSRWMTYKQGQSVGAQVRKGEKGTIIEYYKFEEERKVKDEKGKDVIGANGKPLYEKVKLQSPQRFCAVVFHASQFENMPEKMVIPREFNPIA